MTDKLRDAAQALIDRWDSPAWGGSAENLRHTGEYIAELRAALDQPVQWPTIPRITDAMALAFHNALTDMPIGRDEVEEIKIGLRAALTVSSAPVERPSEAFHNAVDHLFDEHGIIGVSPDELWEVIRPSLAQQPAVLPEWLEQAFREGWASCRDSEFIGQEAEDWEFGNSFTNSIMIDATQQPVRLNAAPEPPAAQKEQP